MSWWVWLIIVYCVVGFVGCFRWCLRDLLSDDAYYHRRGMDWTDAFGLLTLATLMTIVCFAGFWPWRAVRAFLYSRNTTPELFVAHFAGEAKRVKQREKDRELREREKHIEVMEAQLKVGPHAEHL